ELPHQRGRRTVGEELARGFLQRFLFVGETEIHDRLPFGRATCAWAGRARARRRCFGGSRSCRPRSCGRESEGGCTATSARAGYPSIWRACRPARGSR